jgi:hypothetical protein
MFTAFIIVTVLTAAANTCVAIAQPRKLPGPPPPLPRRRRASEAPLLVAALEKFNVNVETRACRASSMVKPWEVRGSNKEERITKPL